MWKRAGGAGTISHPSSKGLPNAHVIFRWNKDSEREIRGQTATRLYLTFLFAYLIICRVFLSQNIGVVHLSLLGLVHLRK